jgi:hypothetical protein
MSKIKFMRNIVDARDFEIVALRDVKEMVLPYTSLAALRGGRVSAQYLEASSKGDVRKLAVLFDTGTFVDIAYVAVGGVYAYGGFILNEKLESLTITERVTEGFFELDVVIAGEAVTLAFDADLHSYAPVEASVASDAVLASFGARKAA